MSYPAPAKWTQSELLTLTALRGEGVPFKRIASVIGRSESSIRIQSKRQGLDCPSYPGRQLPLHSRGRPPMDGDGMNYGESAILDSRTASIMHLVDLKRAGHSPTRTELKITPDAIAPMRMAIPLCQRSLTGSLGAMCADNAGRGY